VSASRSFHSGSRRSGAIVNIDNLCLEALPGGDLCDGAPLRLSRCDTCSSPPWSFTKRGEIIGPEGMCLDAAWGHTADGTAVRLWECNGTDSQQWRLTHDDAIVGPGGKCLSTRCARSRDESALELQCCDGAPEQRWYFDPD
jgi:streptogrisin C